MCPLCNAENGGGSLLASRHLLFLFNAVCRYEKWCTFALTKLLIIFVNTTIMNEKESTTEAQILKAAEEEFLSKGFKGAKTTAIAERAGVTHGMLHYYFRTKENLFQMVFKEKVKLITDSIIVVSHKGIPFDDIIRQIVELHFDFIKQNPGLINFIYTEIVNNKDNRALLYDYASPRMREVTASLGKLLCEECEKGKIRKVSAIDLMMNIASLNLVTFLAYPIMREYTDSQSDAEYNEQLWRKKESNVQFILHSLKE